MASVGQQIKNGFKIVGYIFGGMIVLGLILQMFGVKPDPPKETKNSVPEPIKPVELTPEQQKAAAEAKELEALLAKDRKAREHPEQGVSIAKFDWEKGGFDTVMIAHFTLKNDNEFDVKDITVKCETMAGSDTILSRPSTTIFEVIPAKKTKRFTKVNMGFMNQQSSRAGCNVTAASISN